MTYLPTSRDWHTAITPNVGTYKTTPGSFLRSNGEHNYRVEPKRLKTKWYLRHLSPTQASITAWVYPTANGLMVSYRRQRGFHTRRIHGPQPTSRPQRRLMLQPKHALGTHWPIKANKPRASTTRSCLHRVQGQTAPHSAPNSQRASIQWTSSGTRTTESNRIHERSLHWTNLHLHYWPANVRNSSGVRRHGFEHGGPLYRPHLRPEPA